MQNQCNNCGIDSLQDLQFHMSHEIAHKRETLFIYNFEFDKQYFVMFSRVYNELL